MVVKGRGQHRCVPLHPEVGRQRDSGNDALQVVELGLESLVGGGPEVVRLRQEVIFQILDVLLVCNGYFVPVDHELGERVEVLVSLVLELRRVSVRHLGHLLVAVVVLRPQLPVHALLQLYELTLELSLLLLVHDAELVDGVRR